MVCDYQTGFGGPGQSRQALFVEKVLDGLVDELDDHPSICVAFFAGSVQLSCDAIVEGPQIITAFYAVPELLSEPLRHSGLFALPYVVATGEESRNGEQGLRGRWSLDDINRRACIDAFAATHNPERNSLRIAEPESS